MRLQSALARTPRRGLRSLRHARRGSVLITAAIFAMVIALMLTSYIKMSTMALNASQRTFYRQAAFNLAEAGVEQVVWSMRNNDWTGWEDPAPTSNQRRLSFSEGLEQNVTGSVKVWIENIVPAAGTNPVVISKAIVTPPGGGPPLERWIRVTLSRSSLFSRGLLGRTSISFSGANVVVDAYDSSLGPYTPAPATTNRIAEGSVGVVSANNNALSISNGKIFGIASIGAASANGTTIGSNPGAIISDTFGGTGVNYGLVQTQFNATLDNVVAPTPSATNGAISISGAASLPGTYSAVSGGRYHFTLTGLSLSGSPSNKLTITGPVTLIVTDPTVSLSTSGNGSIAINSGGSLHIYTPGNVSFSGNGVANNTSAPVNFQIWSTKAQDSAGAQSISVSGNGVLAGIVYAPAASLSINGGGSSGAVYGAMVGDTISLNGGANFHYDKSLANFGSGAGWGVASWNELQTPAQRASFLETMSF